MIKYQLIERIAKAVNEAQAQGRLHADMLPPITVEHPQNAEHGDYATSLPLKMAGLASARPMDIARDIAELIWPGPEIDSIQVAPPGFINFTLNRRWLARQVESVLKAGHSYGRIPLGNGKRVQIEFVSVNPTGPLHVGHGRGAILGSVLASVLAATGYHVEKEYYINDAGAQTRAFAHSLYVRYQQEMGVASGMPDDGYHGSYMIDLAREIIAGQGDRFLNIAEKDAVSALGRLGLDMMLEHIKVDLEALGVTFDVWFSEQSLYNGGQYEMVKSILDKGGHITEKEGATWFVSTALGEDKDNVIRRGDGYPTYFAADIAYHYNKLIERKFDSVIDIWGADHQGHVSRMKAVLGALGIDPNRLRVIISQLVTLRRGEELVRVSKRSGDIITLREVIDEVGSDACRFFFLARSADSQMDFDLELAKKQSEDNPVYYVQYAHARIASIIRLARERDIDFSDGDVTLLTEPAELGLIRKMLLLPEIVELIANSLEPHHLAYYAQDIASTFHGFYTRCRVVDRDNEKLTKARLKLVAAARIVLARTLELMGVTAPDSM
ncbi:MAG: arginine--tRNA ligase [Dehalococcoidales bacterium]